MAASCRLVQVESAIFTTVRSDMFRLRIMDCVGQLSVRAPSDTFVVCTLKRLIHFISVLSRQNQDVGLHGLRFAASLTLDHRLSFENGRFRKEKENISWRL